MDSLALIYSPIYVFTRHINMECFEFAVHAKFVSYAPTFFNYQYKVDTFNNFVLDILLHGNLAQVNDVAMSL